MKISSNIAKVKTPLVITQAKKIAADGTVTYYYSTPHIALFDIKGWLWYYRRLKAFRNERHAVGDINVKVIYD